MTLFQIFGYCHHVIKFKISMKFESSKTFIREIQGIYKFNILEIGIIDISQQGTMLMKNRNQFYKTI